MYAARPDYERFKIIQERRAAKYTYPITGGPLIVGPAASAIMASGVMGYRRPARQQMAEVGAGAGEGAGVRREGVEVSGEGMCGDRGK